MFAGFSPGQTGERSGRTGPAHHYVFIQRARSSTLRCRLQGELKRPAGRRSAILDGGGLETGWDGGPLSPRQGKNHGEGRESRSTIARVRKKRIEREPGSPGAGALTRPQQRRGGVEEQRGGVEAWRSGAWLTPAKAATSPTGSFCSIVSILMGEGLQLSLRRSIPPWKMFVFVTQTPPPKKRSEIDKRETGRVRLKTGILLFQYFIHATRSS